MDWKACAADDLRRYRYLKIGILNSREKLAAMEKKAKLSRANIKTSLLSSDDNDLDTLIEYERLKQNMKMSELLAKLIERGLSSLSEEEKTVLDKCFINGGKRNLTSLTQTLGYEQRSLYRLRDRALKKFTLSMYGVDML